MLGLETTINDRSTVRAALPNGGVLTVMAYVAHSPRRDDDLPRSHVEIGGLDPQSGEQRWLHEALLPGDEVRVVAADIDEPDPWTPSVAPPPALEACPSGIEVAVNGEVVARRAVAAPGAALALVTWSRDAATDPGPGDHFLLDVGTDFNRELSTGDEVVIRALDHRHG